MIVVISVHHCVGPEVVVIVVMVVVAVQGVSVVHVDVVAVGFGHAVVRDDTGAMARLPRLRRCFHAAGKGRDAEEQCFERSRARVVKACDGGGGANDDE
jgi:hypothetical protein